MEGRVPPSTGDNDKSDDPPIWQPSRRTPSSVDVDVDNPPQWRRASFNSHLPLAPPPGRERDLETYVVQVPKDQIYRVPPPENAKYIERYFNPEKKEKPFCKRFFWIFITVAVLVLLIGAVVVIFYVVFRPKTPTFSIAQVIVNTPKSSSSKDNKSQPAAPAGFDISLKINNPNDKMRIDYRNGNDDNVSLNYKDKKLGTGHFPEMSQDVTDSTTIHLTLKGSKNPLPSTNDTVSLVLKIDLKSKFRLQVLKLWEKKLLVTCNLKVNDLGPKTKISSQNCDSDLTS